MCVAYDFSDAEDNLVGKLYPVQYTFTGFRCENNMKPLINPYYYLRKSKEWEPEHEWRFIEKEDRVRTEPKCEQVGEYIRAVYFGIGMDIYFETGNDNVRRKVLEIAQNQGIRLQSVCDEESEEITPQRKHKRPGLLSALFFGALTDKDSGKMSGLQFSVGDHVRVRYRGQEGTIIGIHGNLYMVSLKDGAYVDSYIASDLGKCW